MAVDLLQITLEFLAEYGLVAVFVLLVLDGAMLMPVLPGEAVMIMAVSQYASDLGDLAMLVALTTAAGIVGSLILYGIARVGGRSLIERHPRLFMMDRRRRESLEESFEKPLGQSLVLFLRVIPLTRIIVNIPAGLARMPLGRFVALSAIGMALFHSGFLWLAFEYQQPGSAVAQQAAALQQAYATPAWEYLQANEAVAIVGALLIGAWLSFRSSRRMFEHPRGSVVSILGWLSARVLFFGSLAIGAAVYYDPTIVYQVALGGGTDIPAIARALGLEPDRMLGYAATAFGSIGLFLIVLERMAKSRRREAEIEHRAAQAAAQAEEDEGSDAEEPQPSRWADLDFEDVSG